MARSASSVQDPEFVELSDSVLIWFSSNAAAFVAGFVLLFVIWAALAVLQVAVIGGLVAESDVAASGGSASFARGMRIGFRHWWRTAAVYLPLALPALVIMLAGSIALYATVALPLQRGSSLEPSQIARGFTLVSALSPLVLLAIHLSWDALLGDARPGTSITTTPTLCGESRTAERAAPIADAALIRT
jgi:hypothetical protein